MALDLTKQKPTALITFLLDRSASMSVVQDATIESLNAYVNKLKQESDATIDFTLLQFDCPDHSERIGATIEKTCVAVPVRDAPALSRDNYVPRGTTPLIEACVRTIEAIDESLRKRTDKPKVTVCIQTDGQENQSAKEYTWERLRALVSAKMEIGWEFNFMGAGIDAYKQAAMMGVRAQSTMSYDHMNLAASSEAFVASASNSAAYSAGRRANTAYTSDQKRASGDKYDPDINAGSALDLTNGSVAPTPNSGA